jgi:hypothetical protein
MSIILTTDEGLFRITAEAELIALQRKAGFTALARAGAGSVVYYAATDSGEIYRSNDAAFSWEAIGAIPGFRELSSLGVDPRHPDHLLAGMEPAALFHSEDGGRAWREDPAIRRMSEENG